MGIIHQSQVITRILWGLPMKDILLLMKYEGGLYLDRPPLEYIGMVIIQCL